MTATEITRDEALIERIEKLDAGRLAKLRRGCGERDPVEGRCPWFIGSIQGADGEPVAFLIAGLLAQYKTSDIKAGGHRDRGNFGRTWKRAIAGKDSESIKRRFHILLDADFDPRTGDGDLPYRLRQMVRYAAGRNIGVDWPTLVKHIRNWDAPGKWVQKEWARAFFSDEQPDDEQKPTTDKE